MRISKIGIVMLILVLGMLSSSKAQTPAEAPAGHPGLPYATAATPKAVDRGALSAQGGSTPISVTVVLSLRKLDEAESLMKSLHTPGDPQFHQFLTSDQFVARFGPANADVTKVIAALAKYGLTAERATTTTLKVTGLPADMERAFAVRLHSYEVPAHDNAPGYTYHAPLSLATIPAELSGTVAAIVGLDSRPNFHPHYKKAPSELGKARSTVPSGKIINPFEFLTVADFASYYDVNPLYSHGVTGKGRTLGIVTLASFTPSDAFTYWSALGLAVDANRLKIVNIDGGPGAPSDASGSLETTLDVEQSGGLAPGAKIIVYQAPNTNQGFIDAFVGAVDDNLADSVSVSWGFWEWYQNLENSPVTDPTTGKTVGLNQAFHEFFVRAAIQGQTLFAASGDGGAYDINNDLGCVPPICTLTLSVDNPASDPAITAAGGTTLPGIQKYCVKFDVNGNCIHPYYVINIPRERVWGWDYLEGLCAILGCNVFPGGSGGGVSILYGAPLYQLFLPGVQLSQPGQDWEIDPAYAALFGIVNTSYNLPAYFPGRNVPDLSFNADPQTGYLVFYTSEPAGTFAEEPGWGGTSFVGPQLNGVTALLGEYLQGSRLGLLNFAVYNLALTGQGYKGLNPPLNAIKNGDNWFYVGSNGYNPAAGLGTLDVWNFARFLKSQ